MDKSSQESLMQISKYILLLIRYNMCILIAFNVFHNIMPFFCVFYMLIIISVLLFICFLFSYATILLLRNSKVFLVVVATEMYTCVNAFAGY